MQKIQKICVYVYKKIHLRELIYRAFFEFFDKYIGIAIKLNTERFRVVLEKIEKSCFLLVLYLIINFFLCKIPLFPLKL